MTVSNVGNLAGDYEAGLIVNDEILETRNITLGGGESTNVSFVFKAVESDYYEINVGGIGGSFMVSPKPVDIIVDSLTIYPEEIEIDEAVNITVTITNPGETEGNYTVILKIDGNVIDTKEIVLTGVDSQDVTFTTKMMNVGQKTIDVNGLIDSLIVLEEVLESEQPPAVIEQPEIPSESAVSIIPTPAQNLILEPDITDKSSWRLAGIIVSCVLIIGILVALLIRRRRSSLQLPTSGIRTLHLPVDQFAGDSYLSATCYRCGSTSHLKIQGVRSPSIQCPVCLDCEIECDSKEVSPQKQQGILGRLQRVSAYISPMQRSTN